MTIEVLAQGRGWLVVAKPSGLAVHRSALVGDRDTLVGRVRRRLGVEVDPVHRLDRPTSGCLLLSSDRALTPALQAGLVAGAKQYAAFVRGRIEPGATIDFQRPLTDTNGVSREARTVLTAVASSADPRCSLVLAAPVTGRFHQIRRHLRDLSHPVLGDSAHGDTRVNRWWREHAGLTRLALHCLSLSLQGPEGPIEAQCPLPPELLVFGRGLPFWAEAVRQLPVLEAA